MSEYNKNQPLISVIIVVFNAIETIANAIESVINQKGSYEVIIIDGGSNDGTTNIIKEYESRISYWVTESDKGIYDAMNKGIRNSKGKWIYFLGADDTLLYNVLFDIQPILLTSEEVLIFGDIQYENGGRFFSHFSLLTLIQNTVHHQAAFYKRKLFDEFSYNSKLKVISDYELNLIIFKDKLKFRRINKIIAICYKGGRSRDPRLSFVETNIVRRKHIAGFANYFLRLILYIKFIIMSLYRQLKKIFLLNKVT